MPPPLPKGAYSRMCAYSLAGSHLCHTSIGWERDSCMHTHVPIYECVHNHHALYPFFHCLSCHSPFLVQPNAPYRLKVEPEDITHGKCTYAWLRVHTNYWMNVAQTCGGACPCARLHLPAPSSATSRCSPVDSFFFSPTSGTIFSILMGCPKPCICVRCFSKAAKCQNYAWVHT